MLFTFGSRGNWEQECGLKVAPSRVYAHSSEALVHAEKCFKRKTAKDWK
jgi:hypothetical protein